MDSEETIEERTMVQVKVDAIVERLRACVDELEELYPGRRFTLDGHLVGSLGECYAQDAYGMELLPVGTKTHDAVKEDRSIQIKTTQRNSIGISHKPDYLLVLHMGADGSFSEVYYGPGARIWDLVKHKKRPKNGQYNIAVSKLRDEMRKLQTQGKGKE